MNSALSFKYNICPNRTNSFDKYLDLHYFFTVTLFFVHVDKDTPKVPVITQKIPEPQIPYPKISDLSIEDQKYFLDIYKEYISGQEIGSKNVDQLQVL